MLALKCYWPQEAKLFPDYAIAYVHSLQQSSVLRNSAGVNPITPAFLVDMEVS